MTYRLPAVLMALTLLAGCEEEPVVETSENDGRAAEGEVIGGTISDEMLPLDTIRSQPALVTIESDAGAGGSAGSAAASATGGEAAQAEPTAAAEPEPEGEADEDAT